LRWNRGEFTATKNKKTLAETSLLNGSGPRHFIEFGTYFQYCLLMGKRLSPGRQRRKERRAARRSVKGSSIERAATILLPSIPKVLRREPNEIKESVVLISKENDHLSPKEDQKPSCKQTTENNEEKTPPSDGNSIWMDVASILGGILFAHYAQAFFSTGHMLGGVWCTFGGTIAAFFLICHIFSKARPNRKKGIWSAFGTFSLVAAISFIFWSLLLSRPTAPEPSNAEIANTLKDVEKKLETREADTFQIEVKTALVWLHREQSRFWLAYTNESGVRVRSPIPLLIYIRFVNLTSTPFQIAAYSLDTEVPGGWASTKTIDARMGQLFSIANDFTNAIVVDCKDTAFNSLIENKAILPNKPIEGWIYCDGPFGAAWRLRMKERSGAKFTKVFTIEPQDNYDVEINKASKEGGFVIFKGTKEDISALPWTYYGSNMLGIH
jgi:hypothetical protein